MYCPHLLKRGVIGLVTGLLLGSAAVSYASQNPTPPATSQYNPDVYACVQEMLAQASDDVTLGHLRGVCHRQQESMQERSEHALRQRLVLEKSTELNPFVITPHMRNYVMPLSYWTDPIPHDNSMDGKQYRHVESKFQISIKAPIAHLWDEAQLYGAFTGTFFWQSYSGNISRPFRETNYMPEIFIARPVHWHVGPIDSQLLMYGAIHQSNGQDVPLSRSWNRLFVRYIFQTGPWYWSFKPWWRISEHKKDNPLQRHGDDNPDILHYMGHFELRVSRPFGHQVVELMLRNNLHHHKNAGAVQVNYTFPLHGRFKGIVQAFSGYGDSLINYNDYENRFSIGILLTDTL